jgi:hypothetical protein
MDHNANPVVLIIAEETHMTKRLRQTTRASKMEVQPKRSWLAEYGQIVLKGMRMGAQVALWDLTQTMLERWSRPR